ncbi:MAG TPA: TetR family transcriptional regulator [Propionicimonas sp.]|nr:TetR family transcriptional regulator [Propionicimonas sp.]
MKESATGRERIIAAAIELFAEQGYAGASVRDIAARAGVTGGLIVHHFGTKAALRDECDAAVIESVFTAKATPDASMLAAALAGRSGAPAHLAYLRRMLTDDDARADAIFDRVLAATRNLISDQQATGVIRPELDAEHTAATVAIYGLAPLLLPRQLARAFGAESLDQDTLTAVAESLGAILTAGLYAASPYPEA